LTLAALIALVLASAAASAPAAQLQSYSARLHVAGGLTITTKHDFTGSCSPGQAWTLEEKVEVEVTKTVKVERNGDRLLSSTDARQPGGAIATGVLSGYSESNYCPPEDPVAFDHKPSCERHAGTLAASLLPDPRNRKPFGVSIGLTRLNGGSQDASCVGAPVLSPTPRGTKIDALQTIYGSIVLPLGLKVSAFRTLARGKKLIGVVNVGGPCDAAVAYGGAHASVFRDDQCEVDGVFNVEVKRLK
jgi:hypothetical protein